MVASVACARAQASTQQPATTVFMQAGALQGLTSVPKKLLPFNLHALKRAILRWTSGRRAAPALASAAAATAVLAAAAPVSVVAPSAEVEVVSALPSPSDSYDAADVVQEAAVMQVRSCAGGATFTCGRLQPSQQTCSLGSQLWAVDAGVACLERARVLLDLLRCWPAMLACQQTERPAACCPPRRRASWTAAPA